MSTFKETLLVVIHEELDTIKKMTRDDQFEAFEAIELFNAWMRLPSLEMQFPERDRRELARWRSARRAA